ncbi:MAG TPA: type II toxin-antitoxin system ParD family antitoxin [Casimicrobiaceae bacterium]|nr:type II toxin-antitoxin system ParD family antitoxin [Casimicrobiaceae bacterium]
MNISLPPRLETLIRKKIESGLYESHTQVIEEALFLLEERDQVRSMRRDRLLEEIAKGIYQADNRHLVDGAEVLHTLRKKPVSSGA